MELRGRGGKEIPAKMKPNFCERMLRKYPPCNGRSGIQRREDTKRLEHRAVGYFQRPRRIKKARYPQTANKTLIVKPKGKSVLHFE